MASQKGHKLGYPNVQKGGYSSGGHSGGPGRGQNLTPPAAGADYNKPFRTSSQAPVSDGPNGRGYQKDAHSDNHHNNEAVGHPSDHGLFHYRTTLHSEKMDTNPVPDHGKARHHPSMSGDAHKFKTTNSGHGFGYSTSNMKGPLRMSGHSKAHRIGCK